MATPHQTKRMHTPHMKHGLYNRQIRVYTMIDVYYIGSLVGIESENRVSFDRFPLRHISRGDTIGNLQWEPSGEDMVGGVK